MKKIFLLTFLSCMAFNKAQSWSLTGNSATDPTTNFIGTTDNKDLVFKTNNAERLRIGDGRMFFKTNTVDGDGIDIIDETQNRNSGTDVVWIKSVHPQANDVGLLSISTANWQYPIFSARENGKILMGVNAYNSSLASCSDCNSYRLFVKDGIKTEKIKVEFANVHGWADYVFSDSYKLLPLNEVKKFITLNKHLPEVPSAEEVVKNGVELKEMNVLLLKKIEELTLHLIDLNEKVEKQNEKIQQLEKNKL
ncbi:hypothetical protein [Chryseobacterium sp.]|uniref:hypothetical protein n=1 Tax=Chryseobacterium sp. TaxID=1871047 RepID=UPI0012E07229|nr:hypothetical protein [Chryseobacterium sp.]